MIRLFALLFVATSFPAQAASFTDLAAIDRDVMGFTGAAIGQPGGAALPIDRRLRLAPCRTQLTLGWHTPRRDTVLVQCPDAGGWRLFVPVRQAENADAAPAVLRGEAVTIEISGPGFSIAQPGEAMEPGAIGAWIRVRGTSAKAQPMRAQVIRPGLVGIALP
jgi:flagella basal body P-ring formation protein FlgA